MTATSDAVRLLAFDDREIIARLAAPGVTAIDADGSGRTLIGLGVRRDLPTVPMAVSIDPAVLTTTTMPAAGLVGAMPWSHWRERVSRILPTPAALPADLAAGIIERQGLLPVTAAQLPVATMTFCHAQPILLASDRLPAHLRPAALLPLCLVYRPRGPSLFTAFWRDDTENAAADLGFGLLSPETLEAGAFLRREPTPRPQLLRHVVFERGDDPLRTTLRDLVGGDPDRHRQLLQPHGILAERLAAAIIDKVMTTPAEPPAPATAEPIPAPAA